MQKLLTWTPMTGAPVYFAMPDTIAPTVDTSELAFYPEPPPDERAFWEQQVVQQSKPWQGWSAGQPPTWVPTRTLTKQRLVKQHAAVYGDDDMTTCEACGESWPCYVVKNLTTVSSVVSDTAKVFDK